MTIWMSPEPPHGLNPGGSNGRTDHLFAALTLAGYNILNLDGSRSVFNGRTTLPPGDPEARRLRPTTRCFFDLRHRQLQQRFRSRPGSLRPADVEGVVATMSCQVRRKEITLSLDTTVANMVTLLQWFLFDSAADASLGQFGRPGADFFDTPASIYSFAGEFSDEHPGGADHYAAAEVLLERFI